eukprot:jgi/Chlat1/1468/Chrsp12S02072
MFRRGWNNCLNASSIHSSVFVNTTVSRQPLQVLAESRACVRKQSPQVMISVGMAALQPRLQRVSDAALLLLQEKANCQEVDENGDSNDEEDAAQDDDVLINAAAQTTRCPL